MPELDEALSRLHAHEGVQHVLLVGQDGLVVRHLGRGSALEPDAVAAMIPGVAAACSTLGRATGKGDFQTAVVELARGVAIVLPLSSDLLLALVLDPSVGFAPLLREVRRERAELAALL